MTDGPETQPGVPLSAAWDWMELLTRLCQASGVNLESERLAVAARHAEQASEPWHDSLVRACQQLGVPASPLQGTVRQVAAAVGPAHPLVTRAADGRWLILVDRRGTTLAVDAPGTERSEWLGRGKVSELVDPEALGAMRWVAVDPPVYWSAQEPAAAATTKQASPTPLRRLRWLLLQERNDIVVIGIYAVGVGVLALALPVAVQALVNNIAFGALIQPLFVLSVLLLGGLLFAAALKALEQWVVEVLQQRLFVHLVSDLSSRLPRLRISSLDGVYGPELMNRFFDLFMIQKSAALLLVGGIEIVLTALVGMLVIAFYHPFLLAFDLVLILSLAVVVLVMGRGAVRTALQESSAKYRMAAWLEELVRLPGTFKLGGGPELARSRANELAWNWLAARKGHFRVYFRQVIGMLALQAVGSAALLGVGGWLVIQRELTLGQLVAAELIVTGILASFARAPKHFAATYDLLAGLDKVGLLVDLPMEPPDDAVQTPRPAPTGSRLCARGVNFALPDGSLLFEDLKLTVEPGERVALVGLSGSGRTTLVDLLVGARQPSAGQMVLDGVDLRDLGHDRLRARVAAVRGPDVFEGTVAENVAFGRKDLSVAAVREALREVSLLDAVSELPQGLHTKLAPTGKPFSRGQAVRLALARAIVGRPSLLIIDRAPEWLDDEVLQQILPGIVREDAPWTLIVATDRQAVLQRCSRTLRLREGKLEEVTP